MVWIDAAFKAIPASQEMPIDPILLIDLIYKNCRQQNLLLPQTTRLVKLMYLAEVEYFRQERERLTNLEWRFYLYGPYPPSLKSVLGEPEIETSEWKTGKVSEHIVRDENVFVGAKASVDTELVVSRLVKE